MFNWFKKRSSKAEPKQVAPVLGRISLSTELQYFRVIVKLLVIETSINRWIFLEKLEAIANAHPDFEYVPYPWGAYLKVKYDNTVLFKKELVSFMSELQKESIKLEKDLGAFLNL